MFEHYYRELLNFCSRFARNPEGAADAVQETYARVLAAQKEGGRISEPRALLYRTARNLMIDQQRRAAVRERYHDETDNAPDVAAHCGCEPETAAMSRQAVDAMLAVIEAMPPRRRQAFVMHRFEDLSHAEIAARMGISRKMVEEHIKTAMLACRRGRAEWDSRLAARAPAAPRNTESSEPSPP
ncbi:RNA polymerase sigma factor [Pollutimonas bauzanensis]|uniref:RNA polymerase sigma-70 factor, ECF subfamily n=1 Tax=Pollutimonas bauzanensis TaxID=658167 RepID=A0A1M6A6P0_9BURK|nr:sigma-70 family RNA polymerase sigma factor [Pollutimonas bauzanensis]SHI32158.1 RNA polymerase sigma-70 factor, ECF subfamily [Pollutimonas bauzanensis]